MLITQNMIIIHIDYIYVVKKTSMTSSGCLKNKNISLYVFNSNIKHLLIKAFL